MERKSSMYHQKTWNDQIFLHFLQHNNVIHVFRKYKSGKNSFADWLILLLVVSWNFICTELPVHGTIYDFRRIVLKNLKLFDTIIDTGTTKNLPFTLARHSLHHGRVFIKKKIFHFHWTIENFIFWNHLFLVSQKNPYWNAVFNSRVPLPGYSCYTYYYRRKL